MFCNIARVLTGDLLIRIPAAALGALLFLTLGPVEETAMAGSATLSWSAPTTNIDGTPLTDLAGYKVYYGTTSKVYGTSVNIGLNVGSPPAYTVNNLGTGTYYFAVTAYDTAGLESGFSNEGSKSFTGPAISAITASNISASGATITWTTSISATSQVEYGASTAYGSLTALDSTLVTGHSQSLIGLLAGTVYHYRVRSADGSGALSVSGDNTFTTTSNPGPVISAVASSNITASGATVTWTTGVSANSQVEYGTTTAYGSLSTLNTALSTSHSQALSGLSAGTVYHFRVRSADAAGALSVSGDYTFTTTLNVGPVISAVASGNITASGATISWTTSISATSQVEYGATTAYGSMTALDSALVTGHTQTLSGLLAGTLYHYRVRSADGSGALSVSGDNTFTTTSNPGPVISAVAAANVSTSGAAITWTTNVPANSQVEYGTTTAYGTVSTLDASYVTSHSQSLSSLSAGTVYHFRVRSADGTGTLSISGDGTFSTSNPPPVISAIGASGIGASSATVSWTTNVLANSQVEFGTTTAYGALTTLNATLAVSHSQTLSGLTAGILYHFRVRSADGTGALSVSGDNTFTTSLVTGPSISAVTSGGITNNGASITWTTNISATSQVEYGTTPAYGLSTPVNSALGTAHSQSLGGLKSGTIYHYRVNSADGAGNQSVSADYTFTTTGPTRPAAPTLRSRRN